jgi:hypothetical protein
VGDVVQIESRASQEASMSIFDHVQNRFARVQQEEMSLQEAAPGS